MHVPKEASSALRIQADIVLVRRGLPDARSGEITFPARKEHTAAQENVFRFPKHARMNARMKGILSALVTAVIADALN